MNDISESEIDRLSVVDSTSEEEGLLTRFKVPLMIIVLLLIIGGVSAGLWFLLRADDTGEAAEAETLEIREPPEFGNVFLMSDLVINPSSGRRIFMVSIGLEYFDEKKALEIQRREPLLRDNLITFFSTQPPEYLANIKYRKALRSRVKKIMDYQLGEGVITRVFFVKWVFQ